MLDENNELEELNKKNTERMRSKKHKVLCEYNIIIDEIEKILYSNLFTFIEYCCSPTNEGSFKLFYNLPDGFNKNIYNAFFKGMKDNLKEFLIMLERDRNSMSNEN